MKKVKLKTLPQLAQLGFHVQPQVSPDGMKLIVISKGHYGMSIAPERAGELIVAPRNSITEELYEMFRDAFEDL